jgi:hypothetical protein
LTCSTSHAAGQESLQPASACSALHDEEPGVPLVSSTRWHSGQPNYDVLAEVVTAPSIQEQILAPVASRYRALENTEVDRVTDFISQVLDGDLRRFRACVEAIECGVAADSPLDFLLAVVGTADRCLKKTSPVIAL